MVAELKVLYQAGKFEEILYGIEACLPRDIQGNFISDQEKSDVVHNLLAFLAEQMLEMEIGLKSRMCSPKRKNLMTTSYIYPI